MPPGGHEWRAPGSDHLEHHTAEGSLPCKHSRLVVLANLKRSQLHKLCVEAGVPAREMKTSADMVAALAKRDRQFATVEEKKAARQNNTFRTPDLYEKRVSYPKVSGSGSYGVCRGCVW